MSAIMLSLLAKVLLGNITEQACVDYTEVAQDAVIDGVCTWDNETEDYGCTDDVASILGDLYVACKGTQE